MDQDRIWLPRKVHWVVSWESLDRTVEPDLLFENGGKNQRPGLRWLVDQRGAIRSTNAVSVRGLQQVSVGPSHDEITVEAITGWVSVGKSEPVDVGVGARVKEELVEY